jgi:2,5-dioxopentanoate dehydrogenase
VLPSALEAHAEAIADGLAGSITLGVGQFCTNPGLIVVLRGPHLERFLTTLAARIEASLAGTMLHPGICSAYRAGVEALRGSPGVRVLAEAAATDGSDEAQGRSVLFAADANTLLSSPRLQEEVFGPSSMVVVADTPQQLDAVARGLEGQLTATIHAADADLPRHRDLIRILERKAGRLIFNGFPTGVEVCHAMQHGGPYPASTDARTTSVGTAAITRFARPVAYQDSSAAVLPPELRDANERRIWRMIDGRHTRADIATAPTAGGQS